MPRLVAAVYVQDPASHEELILLPGDEPPPDLAVLITNPEAWDVPPKPYGAEEVTAVKEEAAVVETETGSVTSVGDDQPKKPSPRRGRASPSA